MEDIEEVVEVRGEMLKDAKFADDQGIKAQTIMDSLSKSGKVYDMKINVKKNHGSLQR